MDQSEQIKAFAHDIESVVGRYIDEFDLPLASAIGTLEIVKLLLFQDQVFGDDE